MQLLMQNPRARCRAPAQAVWLPGAAPHPHPSMTECPSGHSFLLVVITYIPFSFLSSSNCCTKNTISSLVFAVSTFQYICFEFGFGHPGAVCGPPPAEWHPDQYPLVSVSQFLVIGIIG